MNKIEFIKSLSDMDWLKIHYLPLLILIFILSRIPFINLGFGTDPDAWRIAISSFNLNYFHIYTTSRFPGYPVPEFFNSLVINHGWIATNSLTMIISLISVLIFAMILRELEIKNKGLLVITYAFLPIIWINSTNTMDYMWAMAFIMLTWLFIIKKQFTLAGLMMGLAVESRMTSIFLILPFIYLILRENHKKNIQIIYFLVSMIISTAILLLPLFFQYGTQFLTYYPTLTSGGKILEDLNQFGLFALFFGFIMFSISIKKLIRDIKKNDEILIFLIFAVSLISIIYMGAPYQIEYLIPAIPFTLVLLNKISNRKLFTIFCALLLLNSFISFEITPNTAPTIEKGALIKDSEIRAKVTDMVDMIAKSNINNSIVISAEYFPIISYLNENSQKNHKIIENDKYDKINWNLERNVGYIYLIDPNKIDYWQKKGYKIYYMGNSANEITRLYYKYNLNSYDYSNLFTNIS